MNRKNKYYLIFLILGIPVVIYFYFLICRTYVINGDDLSTFIDVSNAKENSSILNLFTNVGKFRPVSAFVSKFIFQTFQKNLTAYYLFNVFIQTLNTFIFAFCLNFFLRSPLLSVIFSLLYALTRFSFFITSQPLSGGCLEGLALTFFLLSYFFILFTLCGKGKTYYTFLASILFANLSIYTHERYIVLYPLFFLVLFFFPTLKTLSIKHKSILAITIISSVVINVAIKKLFYSMPFFVGTGGTNISFSFV